MNIKDIEAQSGMTRANIRFYEQEDLLHPQRQGNGYRDYSDADLQTLHRIRLLRTLGLSLDEIRALQKDEASLESLLTRQAATLEQQSAETQQRARLCRDISHSGARYATLDGQRWLDALTAEEPTVPDLPKTDTYHKVTAPWRRFFARHFDLFLYSAFWMMLGLLLLSEGPSTESGAAWMGAANIIAIIMMALVEPLLLSTWGTTPGKWLLGLSVRNNTGQKLTYGEGFYRTVQALWGGAGFFIPIFELVQGYKRYYDCIEGKTLPWEWDSELQLKDEKAWRFAAMAGSAIAVFGALVLTITLSAAPTQRGDMTVAQFADSYNRLARYHGVEVWLDEEGRWTEVPRPDGSVVIHMSDMETPNFVYTEKDGLMTGLSFTLAVENDTETWVPINQNRRILAILAFAQAYDPTPLNNNEVMNVVEKLEDQPFQPLDETVHGVHITWQLTSSGYYPVDTMGLLVPVEGETPSCSMTFTMEKVS
ncbi:MAG: MerR family transcriptional regulator [Oscillospiraceae bacterium]|nr:MerR family transcriptional regulator [Oscillospiraceae bacterium]